MCSESSFVLYAVLPFPDLKDCELRCFYSLLLQGVSHNGHSVSHSSRSDAQCPDFLSRRDSQPGPARTVYLKNGRMRVDKINHINLKNSKIHVGCVITMLNDAGVCTPLLHYSLAFTSEGVIRKFSSINHQFCLFLMAKGTHTAVLPVIPIRQNKALLYTSNNL